MQGLKREEEYKHRHVIWREIKFREQNVWKKQQQKMVFIFDFF